MTATAVSGLAPESRRLLAALDALGAPPEDASPAELRRHERRLVGFMGPPVAVGAVEDLRVPSRGGGVVPVRRYLPPVPTAGAPLVVYAHGGGWIVGDLEQADRPVRRLCAALGATVVSVDYRLAPEHPFPAALHDLDDVVAWAAQQPDAVAGGVVLAGESAGATLAASVALARGDELTGALLLYPPLDAGLGEASRSPHRDGCWLTTDALRIAWERYLGGAASHAASPAAAPDLRRLPPTLLVLAGCDPLRAEGLVWADRAAAAGAAIDVLLCPGTLHGFWEYDRRFPAAARVTAALRAAVETWTCAKRP